MGRKIIWTNTAKRNTRAIYQYWNKSNHSSIFSRKLKAEFGAAANAISKMPAIGSYTEEAGVLKKIIRAYILFYHFDENNVYIDAVWDARRHPDDAPFYY